MSPSIVIVLWGLAQPIGAKRAAPRSDWIIYLPLIARSKQNPLHQGIATYYDATGAGACSVRSFAQRSDGDRA